MKIDYIITGMDVGGAEMQVVELLLELKKRGHFVRLISLTPPVDLIDKLIRSKIPVVSLGIKSKLSLPLAAFKLAILIRKHSPNIVHAHMFHANILIRLVSAFFQSSIPVICTTHSVCEEAKFRKWLYRMTNKLCDLNTTVSDAARQRYINEKVFPTEKTLTVYNCINTDRFSIIEKQSSKRFCWITVGRLVKIKNQRLILQAMLELPNSDLIIIGEGDERLSLQTFIKENFLTERVTLLGKKDNPVDYYHNADAFVLTSNAEGFALVVAEAMACGLPVVATHCGGPSEIIGDGQNFGITISINDVHQLTVAMQQIESLDFEQRKGNSYRAREKVIEKFSVQKIVSQWENIYLRIQKNRN
ncbi:glycosyltransferase [Salmonella enterica]